MEKIVLAVVLMLAAPAVAATDVNFVAIPDWCGTVAIYYDARGSAKLPRSFALDITADSGAYILDITDYHMGQSTAGSKGYGVFPGSIYINEAGEVNDVGTPVADPCQLPSDTLLGLGTDGITIEMGSLYVGAVNAPDPCGLLCKVETTGDCNLTIAENVGRGKVVLEGATEATTNLPQTVQLVHPPLLLTIAGNVASGAPPIRNLAGVTMNGLPGTPVTDINGDYTAMVNACWSGTVTPTKAQWSFTPKVYSKIQADALGEDYTGTAIECLGSGDVGYAAWITWGMPDCWCFRKQCRGDLDGYVIFGKPVTGTDLDLFKLAFNKNDADLWPIPGGICADVNHDDFFGKRVTAADLDVFKLYFNLLDASVPECFDTHINEWKN